MRPMRKTALLIACTSAISLVLAGCGGGGGKPSGGTTQNATSTSINIATQPWMAQKFRLKDMAKKFEAANPGTTVSLTEYPDDQSLANFALQWNQGKSNQDVVVVNGASTAVQFLAKDLIIDFNKTDFFTGETAKDKFVGKTLDYNTLNGVQFSIPFGLEAYNINANKTYFKTAGLLDSSGQIPNPKTWEDVYQMASKMTARDSSGKVTRPGMTIQWGPNGMYAMLAAHQAARGSIYKDDGTLTFDTPEMRHILEIWKKGADEGIFSVDTFTNRDAGRDNFNAGNVPMLLQTVAHVPEAIPTIGAENSTVVAMPGSLENGSFGFTAGIIVPSASKNQALALKFIKEAMMSDVQVAVGEQWGKLPVLKSSFDQIKAPWKDAMYDLVKISEPAPMYRDLPKIAVTGMQGLQQYLTGKTDLDGFLKSFEGTIASANKNPE